MKRLTMTLTVAVLLASSTAWSKTIYVKDSGMGDGSSWANAYELLQDALDDAVPDDEIWVSAGTYKPTSDYGRGIGDRGKHFRMKNGVAIYGGFDATGDPGWGERDPNTYETILSGDIGTQDDHKDNCYHVFYHPVGTNLHPNALLDGFTISRGKATGDGSSGFLNHTYRGGGMYNADSSPAGSAYTSCAYLGDRS